MLKYCKEFNPHGEKYVRNLLFMLPIQNPICITGEMAQWAPCSPHKAWCSHVRLLRLCSYGEMKEEAPEAPGSHPGVPDGKQERNLVPNKKKDKD